jgi:hypothetical protein
LLALVFCVIGNAADPRMPSLKGITTIKVIIERLDNDAPLTREQLRTDVELKLRNAGIKVVDESQVVPYLYVRVAILPASGSFFYNVDVEMNQWAHIEVSDVSSTVTTWATGGYGIATSARKIRDSGGCP